MADTNEPFTNTKVLFTLIRNHKWKQLKNILHQASTSPTAYVDVNIHDNYGNYLLTYAVRYNKKNIVDLLLKCGARYDIVDKANRCLLYDPIESNYIDIVKLILKHSTTAIGASIVNMKDNNGNIPLHYAILNNNIDVVKILLDYNSNVHVLDNSGYNALHMAAKLKLINIAALLLKYVTNINAKTNKGETALHVALNYGSSQISKALLDAGADPNSTDSENEFTPLHYAVGWNNVELVKYLILKSADINNQDIYGNTPLIYSVKEDHFGCFQELIKQPSIDVNKWNINGKLALHEAFENETPHINQIVDELIAKSDVSFQDSAGNTGMHYLVSHNMWQKYVDVLKLKKINIFAKNSKNITVVDLLQDFDETTFNNFINLVVDSYLNLLKKGQNWEDELDFICSKQLTSVTTNERNILKKKSNQLDFDTACHQIIKEKLLTNVRAVKNGTLAYCQRSYPFNLSDCIQMNDTDEIIEICTFTGTLLDILIGLIYLIKKHKNACTPIYKYNHNDKTLCDFYKSAGLIMSNRCEFLNFEIIWVGFKLFTIESFASMFNTCKTKSRFVIVPLGIELKNGSHSNYLIYDGTLNEVERFEPHGGTTPAGFNYNHTLLDNALEEYFHGIDKTIKLIRPSEYMPRIGFQIMDEQETNKRKIGDPGGFCALWSVWYVDQRLTNCDKHSRTSLVATLLDTIKTNQISFKNMIRNYSRHIVQERDDLLKKSGLTINDWLNDNYSAEQLDKFTSILVTEINKCSRII